VNLLDRAIAWASPEAGLRRAMHRQMLAEIAERRYAAGRTDRRTQDWQPSAGMPDQVLQSSADLLVRRSRELVRDNPWAASALRRLPASIVGTGPTASVQADAQRVRGQVTADWNEFRETGNAVGRESWDTSLMLLIRTVVEAGDALVVWEYAASGERRIPLRYRALPPEYLDRTRLMNSVDGNTITGGVETDPNGRTVAFWIYDRHPQDTLYGRPPQSRRYSADMVDLVFEPLWLHQRRGVPWLAPVALTADDLAEYDKAALWKARMAASFGLVRKKVGPTASDLGPATTDEVGRSVVSLGPGMVVSLEPGEDVSQLTPPPDENFDRFWMTRLYAMAAGLGLPYASLTGDLRQANYSSLREGKLLFWELVDGWQWHMVHDQVLRSAWRRFGRARVAVGRTLGGVLPAVEWSFPKRPWVDPAKDVAALKEEMDLGLATWPDAVAGRGRDPETQLAEAERWGPRLARAGFPIGRGMAASGPASPTAAPSAGAGGSAADTPPADPAP
jgi:lambda family phage portal protein